MAGNLFASESFMAQLSFLGVNNGLIWLKDLRGKK